jgi:hypothetical protein
MNKVAIVSYAGALFLLFLCIHLCIRDSKRHDNLFGTLIMVFGMIPGLAGALYGVYLFLTLENRAQGLADMTAWLLLELGAFELRQFSRSFSSRE